MDIINNEQSRRDKVEESSSSSSNQPRNKKPLLIFVVVLVFVVLLVISLIYFKKSSNFLKETSKKTDDLSIKPLSGFTKKQISILNEAQKRKIIKDKSNDCNNKTGDNKRECLDLLRSLEISFLKDETLCQQLDSQKDQCYKNLAISKKNVDICKKIEGQNLKQFCFNSIYQYQAQRDGNVELCNKLQAETEKEACQESVFEYIGSVEMCSDQYIIDNGLEDKCKSITLLKKAIATNDAQVCTEIPLEKYKENCSQSINKNK